MRQSAQPTDLVLVPCGDGGFAETWAPLSEVSELCIPIGTAPTEGDWRVQDERATFLLDTLKYRIRGRDFALVFTDQRLLRDTTVHVALPPRVALRRLFEDGRVDGVGFNVGPTAAADEPALVSSLSHASPHSAIVTRLGLARVLGVLESPDAAAAGDGVSHARLCQAAWLHDRPYGTLHHAAAAREDRDESPFSLALELDALLSVGLLERFGELRGRSAPLAGHPALQVVLARAATTSGRPDEGLALAQRVAGDPRVAAVARLEIARALHAQEELDRSIDEYRACLDMDDRLPQAHLGLGKALRDRHYAPSDACGLQAAEAHLRRVIRLGGYHEPEAWHHVATCYLASGLPQVVEEACRKSLALRENAVTRRNLVLALHALGRLRDARRELGFLESRNALAAAGLHCLVE